MRYFDASALVKRYVRERGGAAVLRLLASATPATSRLSEVECASAIVRLAREGAFPTSERDRGLAAIERDFASYLIMEVSPAVTTRARQLLPRHRLRAGDAIQLASALILQEQLGEDVPFVVFDDRLSEAATLEGLNPP